MTSPALSCPFCTEHHHANPDLGGGGPVQKAVIRWMAWHGKAAYVALRSPLLLFFFLLFFLSQILAGPPFGGGIH